MNLTKPICIAENKNANVVIVTREHKRAAGILARYLNQITDADFTIQETSAQHCVKDGRSWHQRISLPYF